MQITPSYTFDTIAAEVKNFGNLQFNWDGENGIVPLTIDIQNLISFLNKLENKTCKVPRATVSGDGEVGLFWRESSGLYIDLGFHNGNFSCYARDVNNQEFFKEDSAKNFSAIEELLSIISSIAKGGA